MHLENLQRKIHVKKRHTTYVGVGNERRLAMLSVFLCELFPVNKIGFSALIWFPKAALTAALPAA
jgi:hypothetical protein